MKVMTLAEFEARQQEYAAAEAESNPPEVEEHLSGIVQQLAATPNAVAYKNFTGDHIEETTLLKDEFNQTLNTNITENYAPGVTSTINETAPSINHQVTLNDSHTLNVKNMSETVYSKNEVQNINVTDWKVYHKNFTQNIPTKLTHQVTQSSQVTIDKYEGHIDVQRINADTYTNNFGTQTFNGPMQIHSSSSIAIRGKNIIFGPDTSALDSFSNKDAKYFPKVSGKVFAEKVNLPPFVTPRFFVKSVLSLEGSIDAKGTEAVPLTVDRHGVSLDLQTAVGNYFSGASITDITSLNDPLSKTPTITVGYKNGNISFTETITTSSPQYIYLEIIYAASTEVKNAHTQDWIFSTTMNTSLTARFYPIGKLSEFVNLANTSVEALSEFGQYIRTIVMTGISTQPELVGMQAARAGTAMPMLLRLVEFALVEE